MSNDPFWFDNDEVWRGTDIGKKENAARAKWNHYAPHSKIDVSTSRPASFIEKLETEQKAKGQTLADLVPKRERERDRDLDDDFEL